MAAGAAADAGQPALHAARFVAINVFEQVLAAGGDGDQHIVRRLRVQDDRQLRPVFSQAPDNAQHVFGLVVPVNHVMKAGAAFDQLPVFMAGDQRDLRVGIAFAQCANGGRVEHQIAEGAGGENHDALKGLLRIEACYGPEIARDAGIETQPGVGRRYFPLFRHCSSLPLEIGGHRLAPRRIIQARQRRANGPQQIATDANVMLAIASGRRAYSSHTCVLRGLSI